MNTIKKSSVYLIWLADTAWTEIVKGAVAYSWYVVSRYVDFVWRVLARVR